MVKEVFGGYALSREHVFEWHKSFPELRKEVEVDKYRSRTVTART